MELIDRTPPQSPLTRVPFGLKLLVVTAIGVSLGYWGDPPALAVLALVTALLYAVGRVPFSAWWQTMRTVAVFLIAIIVFQWWSGDLERGVRTAVQMLAMVSLAALITATTPFAVILESVQRWLGPLRPIGVSPETVALTVGMAIRFIPLLSVATAETADAFRARGVRPWPWRLLFPLVRRTLLLAEDVGAVLTAREPVPQA